MIVKALNLWFGAFCVGEPAALSFSPRAGVLPAARGENDSAGGGAGPQVMVSRRLRARIEARQLRLVR
ncbi:hypothetical protein HQQ80_13850 [Microbacteriaceae bacterium VKM Ac-2855]|nr:hypothetical protein [Microbacteriaceae bacterium VKM Ac-2855]